MKFAHLHVHSHYSLLDGAIKVEDLVQSAVRQGMKSVALTDHGNLFGAFEFYRLANEAGIKPILGIEAYISPTHRRDRSMGSIENAAYHILLLAINSEGWRNLLKLSSRGFLEGFYYRPRIDRELLAEFSAGLVCCTACLGGEIPAALLKGDKAKARRIAGEYRDIFGRDRLFVEIQNHGYKEQEQINPGLVELAGELGLGLVGTNDVHFLNRADKGAHEVLTCISTGKALTADGKMRYSPELYLKTEAEMVEALAAWPGAAANTVRIAEMNELRLDYSAKQLPVFSTPNGQSPGEYLAQLAWDGLKSRFGTGGPGRDYTERLDRELKVIDDKGYSSYFLIIYDCVCFARKNSIPAGPRGSGVATLLGYALRLTNIDPIHYGLIFERFTDPQRKEDPDIDLDICQEGRARVIQYVREKYGHVAQIITYGTLKARAAIRDVGRVMAVPLEEVDAICKLIPEGPNVELQKALEQDDLRKKYEDDPRVKEMIDHSLNLEGLVRHSGVHAAGVVICDRPLDDFIPLCKQADSPEIITQWDGDACGRAGLMKMDFLGLRTLTILQRAGDLVRQRTGTQIDPDALPLDDQSVYELFRTGHTDGIFQFESEGMKGVLMQMKPNRIEDLIAANAMYRPGPIKLIPLYCNRKHGREQVRPIHLLVDDLLSETHGVMIYQEQVMQVANRLGKIPLNRALSLIKAISKKKEESVLEEREAFLRGAGENGITKTEAERIFDLIREFAGYGFNKAHSTRYALLAYQIAYFKVHYPREFVAATLTFESVDQDKVVQYMSEARRMGIEIGAPGINSCAGDFTIDGERVRFGLAAVKGVGSKAVEAIVEARRKHGLFRDLFHFCSLVDLQTVNRAAIEALIRCGAFDGVGKTHRAAMLEVLDGAVRAGQRTAADRHSGQAALFGPDGDDGGSTFPEVTPWTTEQMLNAEKETLGVYVSSHPLERHRRVADDLNWPRKFTLATVSAYADATVVSCGCIVGNCRTLIAKKGRSSGSKMAVVTLEDQSGKCEAVVFPEVFGRDGDALKPDALVYLTGTVSRRNERVNIIVEKVERIDTAIEKETSGIIVHCPGAKLSDAWLSKLGGILSKSRGNCEIIIQIGPSSQTSEAVMIRADRQWSVKPSLELVSQLEGEMGRENVHLVSRGPARIPGRDRRQYRPSTTASARRDGSTTA